MPRGQHTLLIDYRNIPLLGRGGGTTMSLGWRPNEHLFFIITGRPGSFSGGQPAEYIGPDKHDWMWRNLGILGDQTLRTLCIMGSHNSGMSMYTATTTFGNKQNLVCQRRDIAGQLAIGV